MASLDSKEATDTAGGGMELGNCEWSRHSFYSEDRFADGRIGGVDGLLIVLDV